MNEFQEGEEIKILPCIDKFHKECIDKWLEKNASCPICRDDIKKRFEN